MAVLRGLRDTEETEGKECVSFFSSVSFSAGTRDKGSNKLIGKTIALLSTEVFLRRAICFLCSNLGGMCALFVAEIPL